MTESRPVLKSSIAVFHKEEADLLVPLDSSPNNMPVFTTELTSLTRKSISLSLFLLVIILIFGSTVSKKTSCIIIT